MSPSLALAPACPSRCSALTRLPRRLVRPTPRRSSSTAFARAHVSTSSRRWSRGLDGRRSPVRPRQGRPARHRVPRRAQAIPSSAAAVNLWVSAIDSIAGVITLSERVYRRSARSLAPVHRGALRPGGRARCRGAVDDAVGPPRAHASAHLARRSRREGGVGEPGGRPRARRVGPGARQVGALIAGAEPPPSLATAGARESSPPSPPGRSPARPHPDRVGSGAGCARASESAHRHRSVPAP